MTMHTYKHCYQFKGKCLLLAGCVEWIAGDKGGGGGEVGDKIKYIQSKQTYGLPMA